MWTPVAEAGGADQILSLLNYGVLGVVVIASAFGWVEWKPTVSRLLNEIERQHTQIDSLVKVYEDKVIPLLTEANRVLSKIAEDERRRREWEEDERRRAR